jgi:glycosyltransferase involved in cell wall biosynthesis
VASDFPAMRRIVMGDPLGPLGAVCEPSAVGDVARALSQILDMDAGEREDLRRRCATAARERWNWEAEAETLLVAYAGLTGIPGALVPGAASGVNPQVRT